MAIGWPVTAAALRDGSPYRYDEDGAPAIVEVEARTGNERHAMLQPAATQLRRCSRGGFALVEDMGPTHLAWPDADGEEARTLRRLTPRPSPTASPPVPAPGG